jgi:hypothetical protein
MLGKRLSGSAGHGFVLTSHGFLRAGFRVLFRLMGGAKQCDESDFIYLMQLERTHQLIRFREQLHE